MANTVNSLNYANTFADWLVATDALVAENNTLAKSDYHKDSGVLYLDNASGNSLESKGNVFIQQALLVQGTSSSATIDNNLTVKYGTVYIKSQDPGTANIALVAHGQANVDGLLYARASGTGLLVSNNASILGDTYTSGNTVTTLNTTTNRLQANSSVNTSTVTASTGNITNLTVGNQLTVNGNFVLTGDTVYDSNIFKINSGSSVGLDSSFEVNRGGLSQNAKFLWKESDKVFKVVNVDTGIYYRLLSDEFLENSITSNNQTTVATSKALNTVSIQANAAFNKANTTLINFIGTNSTTATANNNYVSWASNNGVLISGSSNTITVSTPQDLRTTSAPTFNALYLTNALAVDQGGTGATSASAARTNLLPTGTTAGYVLTTGGPGNFYWAPGGSGGASGVTPGTSIISSVLDYTANGNVSTYVTPTYIPGSNQLKVYLDGVRQYDGYTETGNTSVTFGSNVPNGSKLRLEVDGYYVNPYYANNITFTAPFGDIIATANTIQLAIQDIETRKAALAGASFTGLVTGLTLDANVSNTTFATTAFVKNALNQSSNTFNHNISGNAGTVTNGVYTTGSYSDPSWLTISKTKVGLNNVDNTADSNKSVNVATYLSSTQQLNVITGATASANMAMDSGATKGSFVAKATGTGDANLAGMTFWNDSYAIKLGIRADGYFGLGGWSRGAWSWYSDPSGNMVAAGNITAYSDPRLKEEFQPIQNALSIVTQLDGGSFKWKQGYKHTEVKAGKKDYGILADQVETVLPEIVTESIEIDGEKYKTVAYEKLIPVLIEAIKELKAEVDALKGNNK